MGAYEFIQNTSVLYMIEDFKSHYESRKKEVSIIEKGCQSLLDKLGEAKDKIIDELYNKERLICQKMVVGCHKLRLAIEKNISALENISQVDLKKLGKYKRVLEKEPQRIMDISESLGRLRSDFRMNKKRISDDIEIVGNYDILEIE